MKQIENSLKGQPRFQFDAKLLSMGTTLRQNSNGKNFKVCSVEFADVNGVVQQASAAVYEGNYAHASLKGEELQINKHYLTTATIGEADGKPVVWLQMSHLEPGAPRASVDMFLAGVEVTAPTPTLVGTPKS